MCGEFAESVINRVHSVWESHAEEYPSGYAVFYGPVRYMPELMLIGLNPGGNEGCFSDGKEILCSPDEQMEYVKLRGCQSYRIAEKTASLFESVGLLNLLEGSVKINLNFFRSKKWDALSKQHSKFCQDLTLEIIDTLKPKKIICESLHVLDVLQNELSKKTKFISRSIQKNKQNRRIYASFTREDLSNPSSLIGITHLTGSRPTSLDIKLIGQNLKNDLC